ncbi:MAG TPA: hypothetical protein VMM82_01845 [Spirochaetia bacterium]|nr:hypothetical protein [Spirochaetia bacterium]
MMEEQKQGWHMEGDHRHRGPRGLRIVAAVLAGVVFAAIFALVFGWLVMILWNWIMPPIFHLGQIGYWQGFGILLLAKIIFGAMGSRGPGGRGPWRSNPWHGNPFRKESWHRGDWPGDREWWRYAHDFWQEEGKEAFARFVDRKKTESGAGASPQGDKA